MPHVANQFTPPAGIAVYQDVLLPGAEGLTAARRCDARWALIEPHLPPGGTILDVGSNFGWYAVRAVRARPGSVVASFEADERSALVQREVLREHGETRVALLTRTFRASTLARMAAAGQRFDAVFLLAVLHWLPDFAEILGRLDAMAGHVFLEYPAAGERNVGRPEVVRAIGSIEPCLRRAFSSRDVTCLGEVPGLAAGLPRQIWHIGPPAGWRPSSRPSLDAAALLDEHPIWPPRSWWSAHPAFMGPGLLFTSEGLVGCPTPKLRRRMRRLPEDFWLHAGRRFYGTVRRAAGRVWRRCKMSLSRSSHPVASPP